MRPPPRLDADRTDGAAQAKPRRSAVAPIGFDASAARSALTMPTFYLVPFMCAYLFGAMWIVGGLRLLGEAFVPTRHAEPHVGGNEPAAAARGIQAS